MSQRFTIRHLLILTAFIALAVAQGVSRSENAELKKELKTVTVELAASRPIPFHEVKRQFENALRHKRQVTVEQVTYNPNLDSYSVLFGWPHPPANELLGYTVELKSVGEMRYSTKLVDGALGIVSSNYHPFEVTIQGRIRHPAIVP